MARKPRNLSAEEEALWNSVAKTTTPLSPRRPFSTKESPKPPDPKPTATPPATFAPFQVGATAPQAPQTSIDIAPDVSERLRNTPVSMDRKAFRKLSRGRIRPEGRLDLHGMTLAQAQPALTRFILSARADGKRLVLVITGKGRTKTDGGGPIPERRGVLRDQVPRWLSTPPLSASVIQVAGAHARHGGSGAYYVYLRRSGK